MKNGFKKVVLIIMDGWGEAASSKKNAISQAKVPFITSLYEKYAHCNLLTSGENVGLPIGQMGNSEVGHLNIGAGRVVYQELALINKAIREKSIDKNETLLDTFEYCKSKEKDLHLIGLVSDGGVHSHSNHLIHLCKMAKENGLNRVFIHVFTDGRDTDPKGGLNYIDQLEKSVSGYGAKIATLIGRYYAMDRDQRWERVKLAYDLLVNGEGVKFENAAAAITASYHEGVTDEFVMPVCIVENTTPIALIKEGDAVISFNFRTDRCREITEVLTQASKPDFEMHKLNLYYVTMTNYDQHFTNVKIVYEKDNLVNTLGEVIAANNKTQLRIAETEKYPHVTFFFSGGREDVFPGENRIMIPSPKVATYDLQPAMSAFDVTSSLINELKSKKPDFVCLNFANADMVGHTGVFSAAIEAVETVDKCVKDVVTTGLSLGYSFLITADHGNADMMINEDGTPNTAHTTNPVPCFLVDSAPGDLIIHDGKLADLAPTILTLMNLPIPKEMNGIVLIESGISEKN
ncbi:MAG: 2,3-bisphosphoglycerate-independent phosphoglycerate mutase [Bacteroidetes bacterium]|nr:2,3-bisphosphoglycerate-independent phosphoglycerate mutase [Bacteroidota bacterium]